MSNPEPQRIKLYDQSPEPEDFEKEVIEGLTSRPKQLSPKLFYDAAGSKLFEEITKLDAYYLTNTEKQILERFANRLCNLLYDDSMLVELGAGDASKTSRLIQSCRRISCYMPIDISKDSLLSTSSKIAIMRPDVNVLPVCADYTKSFDLPYHEHKGNLALFFIGSTIGNFEPDEASRFLERCSRIMDERDIFVVGVDLKKDRKTLELAYNDPEGVTAKFNLNLITRINNFFGTNVAEDEFYHQAIYNEKRSRIEMYLVARRKFDLEISSNKIHFEKDESIHTENSYKYSVDDFKKLCMSSHLDTKSILTDEKKRYAIFVLQRSVG
jgi:dimethylhistidine N-methyltransferase